MTMAGEGMMQHEADPDTASLHPSPPTGTIQVKGGWLERLLI